MVQPPSPACQEHRVSRLSLNPHRLGWDPAAAAACSARGWGWDVRDSYQRSPVSMLMCNTVQNKMEFSFKIKLPYRVIYAQRAPQGKKL